MRRTPSPRGHRTSKARRPSAEEDSYDEDGDELEENEQASFNSEDLHDDEVPSDDEEEPSDDEEEKEEPTRTVITKKAQSAKIAKKFKADIAIEDEDEIIFDQVSSASRARANKSLSARSSSSSSIASDIAKNSKSPRTARERAPVPAAIATDSASYSQKNKKRTRSHM